jgi:hypothetical protein
MPQPAVHYLSMSEAAKFCSELSECSEPNLLLALTYIVGIPLDATNYSACMNWIAGPLPPDRIGIPYQRSVLSCIAEAKDCTAASACNANDFFQANDPRCAGMLDAGLDSGIEVCADGTKEALRCDVFDILHCDNKYFAGSKCMIDEDGSRWCASGTNCNIESQCVGSVLDYCGQSSILEFSIDCSTAGLTCGSDPKTGNVDCLTNGKDNICGDTTMGQAPGGTSSCDGSTVLFCNYSWQSPFNCGSMGATCDGTHPLAFCKRADDVCTPYDVTVNKCDGTKVKLCVGGQNVDFDCASIGKTCALSPAVGCH